MSSRELMEIIDHLPDTSAYQKARRGGDWSPAEYREARLVNEMALSRADHSSYMPELVQSPIEQHIEQAVDRYRIEAHDRNLAQLQGKNRKAVSHG